VHSAHIGGFIGDDGKGSRFGAKVGELALVSNAWDAEIGKKTREVMICGEDLGKVL
jgi:hypothetical protein